MDFQSICYCETVYLYMLETRELTKNNKKTTNKGKNINDCKIFNIPHKILDRR